MNLLTKTVVVLLISTLVYLQIQVWGKDQENLKLQEQILKDNTEIQGLQVQVTIEKNRTKVIYRDRDKIKIIYLDNNTPTTITTTTSGETTIDHKWYGLGFSPCLGVSHTGRPLLGANLAYIERFGLGLGLTPNSAYIGVNRVLSWGFLTNTSLGVGYDGSSFVYLSVNL